MEAEEETLSSTAAQDMVVPCMCSPRSPTQEGATITSTLVKGRVTYRPEEEVDIGHTMAFTSQLPEKKRERPTQTVVSA